MTTNPAALMWLVVRPSLLISLESLGTEFDDVRSVVSEAESISEHSILHEAASTGLERFDGWENRNELYAGLGLTYVDSLDGERLGEDSIAVVEDLIRQVTAGAVAAALPRAVDVRTVALDMVDAGPSTDVSAETATELGSQLAAMVSALI